MDDDALEARIARIETFLNKPSWLDQAAMLNGEPVTMGDSFPWQVKVIGLFIFCAAASVPVMLVVARFFPHAFGR